MTTDNLGSPRVITDKLGNVIARRDFMPFGQELGAGIGTRSESLKYSTFGTDNVRQRFTGYEKDAETQLDFAEARMYENRHGRFTSADPLLASASLDNPQTFNRYTYTGNNPINYTDPSGLQYIKSQDGSIRWENDGYTLKDGESDITGNYGIVRSVGNEFARAGANVGDIVQYNANHTISVIPNPTDAQIAQATGTEVRNTFQEIVENGGAALGELAAGFTQGAVGSANPLCQTCDPSPTDPLPRRLGQVLGNGLIGGISLSALVGGGGGSIAAVVTGQIELEPATLTVTVLGVYGVISSTVYASKIISATSPMSGYSSKDIERMEKGKPPMGEDGNPMELHHDEQKPNGDLKEMTRTDHRGKGNYNKNHPNGNKSPSKIDRKQFKKQREQYWKDKAKTIKNKE